MQKNESPSSSRSWRIFRKLLIAFAILVTFIALIYTVEDVHGHFAWAACQRECAAQGIDLNAKSFVPAPVPDDQNFAMTPFLAPLLDFNPDPLRPGQSRWRDTNAYQKTLDFAQDYWKAYDTHRSSLENSGNPRMDLVTLATALHKEAKTPVPDYPTRTAAAADILRHFQAYSAVLDELHAAIARPYSRFNVHYDDADPAGILLPHLAVIKRVALVLASRASAELATGNNDSAFDDVMFSLSLVDSLKGEPFMITHLVRVAMLSITDRVIWEGLATHAWSDQQLEKLQARMSKFTVLADSQLGPRYELAANGVTLFDYLRNSPSRDVANELSMTGAAMPLRLVPSGWLRLEQTSYLRIGSEMFLAGYDPKTGLVHPKVFKESQEHLNELLKNRFSVVWHHRLIASLLTPATGKYYQKSAYGQTIADETVIACALERYRMATGQLPGTLASLTPKFLETIPHDVINGEPLKYEPTGANQFKLYSVGWNEIDDGGKMGLNNHSLDTATGDWIWVPYPAK